MSVLIEVCRIAEDGVVVCELLFVERGVVGTITGADVVKVSTMGVVRVEVLPTVVVYEAARVVPDDLDDL